MTFNQKYRIHTSPPLNQCRFRYIKYIHAITLSDLDLLPKSLQQIKYLTKIQDPDEDLVQTAKASTPLKNLNKTIRKGLTELCGWTSFKLCNTFSSLAERKIEDFDPIQLNAARKLQRLEKVTFSFNEPPELVPIRFINSLKILRTIQLYSWELSPIHATLTEFNLAITYPKTFLGFLVTIGDPAGQFVQDMSLENVKAFVTDDRQYDSFIESLLTNETGFLSLESLSLRMELRNQNVSFLKNMEKFTNIRCLKLTIVVSEKASKSFLQNFALPPDIETLDTFIGFRSWDEIQKPGNSKLDLQNPIIKQFIQAWTNKPKLTNLSFGTSFLDPYLWNVVPEIVKYTLSVTELGLESSTLYDLGLILNNVAEANIQLTKLAYFGPMISIENLSQENLKKFQLEYIEISSDINPLESVKLLFNLSGKVKNPTIILDRLHILQSKDYQGCRDILEHVGDIDSTIGFNCKEKVLGRKEFLEFVMSLLAEMECRRGLKLKFMTNFNFEGGELEQIGNLLLKRENLLELSILGGRKTFKYERKHTSYDFYG